MASLLELSVGTGKWDAGLKKAQNALNNFVQAQGGFQQALDKENEKISQFVKIMGNVESTATTAKGRMNDYKRALEQLTSQYNTLNETQRKAVGPDFQQAIDNIKQKFHDAKAEVDEFNKSLGEVKPPQMEGGGLKDMLGGVAGKFGLSPELLTGAGAAAAGAVAMKKLADKIVDVTQESMKMAVEGEGVRLAFERLNREDILDNLRRATHGTVTDLELMKAAVKFNDFKLPLDELGTMLAFAQQKAKDTGQSVDYMVDSIVTGLGRKSLMILDNLGLSAAEIKEKMAETGDMTKAVGAIIREQMASSGQYIETAADRAAQAEVKLKNAMLEFGTNMQQLVGIGSFDELSKKIETTLVESLNYAAEDANILKTGISDLYDEAMRLSTADPFGYMISSALGLIGPLNTIKGLMNELNGTSNQQNTSGGPGIFKGIADKARERLEALRRDRLTEERDEKGNLVKATRIRNGKVEDVTEEIRMAEAMLKEQQAAEAAAKAVDELKNRLEALKKLQREATDQQTKKFYAQQIADVQSQLNKKSNVTTPKVTAPKIDDKEVTLQQQIAALEKEAFTASEERRNEIAATIQELDKELARQKEIRDALHGTVKESKELQAAEKQYADAVARVQSWQKPNSAGIGNYISDVQKVLSTHTFGSEGYDKLAQNLVDAQTFKNLMQTALQNGLSDIAIDASPMWEKIIKAEDIPNEKWQEIVDKINEFMKDHPIELDFKTGGVKNQQQKTEKEKAPETTVVKSMSAMAGSINSIAGGIQQLGVDMPEGLSKVLGSMQGITTILTGISALVSAIEVITAADAAIPFFAQGGVVHAAGGFSGIVPGNRLSGDQVPALLNSGETVLTRAQAANIDTMLQDAGQRGATAQPYVEGEKIFLGMNNYLRRSGRGELVTSKR